MSARTAVMPLFHKQTALAWAAGIVEGEGCIAIDIGGSGRGLYVSLAVDNSSSKMCKQMRKLFGGRPVAAYPARRGANLRCFRWKVYGADAQAALLRMLPHMVSKRGQVKKALAFPYPKEGKPLTDAMVARRQKLRRELREMKKVSE